MSDELVPKKKKKKKSPFKEYRKVEGRGYAFMMWPLPLSKVEFTSNVATSIMKAMLEGRGVAGAAADCAGDVVSILPYCSDVKDTGNIPAYAVFKIVKTFIELNLFDEVLEDFLSLTEEVNTWIGTFGTRMEKLAKNTSSS
jgi:hypothetical protein